MSNRNNPREHALLTRSGASTVASGRMGKAGSGVQHAARKLSGVAEIALPDTAQEAGEVGTYVGSGGEFRVLVVGGRSATKSDLLQFIHCFEPSWKINMVPNGALGLDLALRQDHRVVIVDSALEGEPGGLDLVRVVRHERTDTILLVLMEAHGAAAEFTKIAAEAARAGADGYIIAEHGPAEIRMRVLFATMRAWRNEVVRCAELEVDLLRQEARAGGAVIDLTKTQWLLLVRMAMCLGKPVANAELCRFARIQRDLEWVNLRDAVRHLRVRLGPVSYVVRSFRGRGYGLASESNRNLNRFE